MASKDSDQDALAAAVPDGLERLALVRDSVHDRPRRFDLLGFTLLAVAIGSFQLMLDRGHMLDWYDSVEIIGETLVAAAAFAMFLVHMMTDRQPFLSRELFRDRNLTVGLVFTALAGLVLIVSATLMPPFLQQLMGYPVLTTGIRLLCCYCNLRCLRLNDLGLAAALSSRGLRTLLHLRKALAKITNAAV